jgi:hypothetical protein
VIYTVALPMTLALRAYNMSILNARPQDTITHQLVPGPDKWVTDDLLGMSVTGAWFTPILLLHFYIITHLVLKRPVGIPTMDKAYAWVAPTAITLITFAYFLSYLSLSR